MEYMQTLVYYNPHKDTRTRTHMNMNAAFMCVVLLVLLFFVSLNCL